MKKDTFSEIVKMFPAEIQEEIAHITSGNFKRLTEIRIRSGQRNTYRIVQTTDEYVIGKHIVDNYLLNNIYNKFINYSSYAYENELRNGYITLFGGHRAGICGRTVLEDGKIKLIDEISSINLRRAAEYHGVADDFYSYIVREYGLRGKTSGSFPNTIIVSPPGCGKTTFLRDLVRLLSNRGFNVGLCDERSEIAGMYAGEACFDIGKFTDVLDGCPKSEGMRMLLRSMAPDIIATDEIGNPEDIEAIKSAIISGVGIITTIHGKSLEDLKRSPVGGLIESKHFGSIVFLKKEPRPCSVHEILCAE